MLATVTELKAEVSSISPLSERIEKDDVLCLSRWPTLSSLLLMSQTSLTTRNRPPTQHHSFIRKYLLFFSLSLLDLVFLSKGNF